MTRGRGDLDRSTPGERARRVVPTATTLESSSLQRLLGSAVDGLELVIAYQLQVSGTSTPGLPRPEAPKALP